MAQSETRLISRRNALTLLLILAICLVAGSFADFALSSAMFNLENPFGVILAAYGQFPTSAAASVAGVLLISTFDRSHAVSSVILAVLGLALNAFALLMAIYEPSSYLAAPLPVLAIAAAVLLVAVNAAALVALRDASDHAIRKYAGFICFVVVAQLVVINVIKIPWGRPRMRMISVTEGAEFQPWWVIGSEQKDALMALGIAAEEFKSFPSGHTASACLTMVVTALPAVKGSLSRYSNALFWGSALVPAVVAFSRIIMGAHFLTDVTAGFTICFLIVLAGEQLFFGNRAQEA